MLIFIPWTKHVCVLFLKEENVFSLWTKENKVVLLFYMYSSFYFLIMP